MGGDEFLILMKDIPGKEIVCRKGQAIVEDFSKYAAQYDTHGIPLSLSIGAVVFPERAVAAVRFIRERTRLSTKSNAVEKKASVLTKPDFSGMCEDERKDKKCRFGK